MVYDPTALILPEELREREAEREAKFGTQFSDHLQCQRFLNGWDNSACILDWNEHILGQLTHTSFMKCAFYHIHLLSESICIFSPVHHQLLEFTQTHVHWVSDSIQPSQPLSSPSPPAFNLSQGLFQWVSSLHHLAKVLEFQLQHQSFQWRKGFILWSAN